MSTSTTTSGSPVILIVIVLIFVAIIGYVVISKIKRRGANWTGTVIDKNVTETASAPTNNVGNNRGGFGITLGGRNAVNRSYTLRIKDDAGKEFSWPVGEGFYESVNVGDRLTKSPGTETPTVLSKAAAPAASPTTPASQDATTPMPPAATPPTV